MMQPVRITLTLACLLLAACGGPVPQATPALPSDGLAATDPCATRLHDISGTMLMYYLLNKKLPERLDLLRPLADAGTELNFTCPASGKPYIYAPGDTAVPVSERRLVLYDATPAHHGLRWGIVAAPAQGDQPMSLWVEPISDAALREFLQGSPPAR